MNRSEARQLGLKRFYSGKECPRGHVADRFVSNGNCVKCTTEIVTGWRRRKPDMAKAAWTRQNASRRARGTYRTRPEKERANAAKWRAANPDRVKEINKASKARRYPRVLEEVNWRRARKLHATPAWADRDKIAAVYELARQLTRETGVLHHVDHIVPLQGENVCGLHVDYNLRAVTAEENLRKRNFLVSIGD